MNETSIVAVFGLLGLSVFASLAVLWIAGFLLPRPRARAVTPTPVAETQNVFLFHDGRLADHDCAKSGFLTTISDWPGLRNWLGNRFDDLPPTLPKETATDLIFAATAGSEDPASLSIRASEGVARVTLQDQIPGQPADRHQALRLQRTLSQDTAALQAAPYAIWKTDKDGDVFWQNTASTNILADQIDDVMSRLAASPPETGDSNTSRISLPGDADGTSLWLDVHTTSTDSFNIHYATDVSRTVQAETAQREFVQTLTKTFANLTTGLAIFDRNSQLALFNPALVDLTSLPTEFLSARPSLMSFFDKLRDQQVMPEPKNYSDWRTQIKQMIETASGGLYQETWSLPNGLTYSVTGRPHPDGAVAFLFEDITAEISLTRRFRAQNDLRQSVLDKLDHAVAVIAASNVVTFCNTACTQMFGVDPDTSFADLSVRDLLAICNEKFPHPEFWKEAENQITCKTLSQPLEETISNADGPQLRCRLLPVSGGATLICQALQTSIPEPRSEPLSS